MNQFHKKFLMMTLASAALLSAAAIEASALSPELLEVVQAACEVDKSEAKKRLSLSGPRLEADEKRFKEFQKNSIGMMKEWFAGSQKAIEEIHSRISPETLKLMQEQSRLLEEIYALPASQYSLERKRSLAANVSLKFRKLVAEGISKDLKVWTDYEITTAGNPLVTAFDYNDKNHKFAGKFEIRYVHDPNVDGKTSPYFAVQLAVGENGKFDKGAGSILYTLLYDMGADKFHGLPASVSDADLQALLFPATDKERWGMVNTPSGLSVAQLESNRNWLKEQEDKIGQDCSMEATIARNEKQILKDSDYYVKEQARQAEREAEKLAKKEIRTKAD